MKRNSLFVLIQGDTIARYNKRKQIEVYTEINWEDETVDWKSWIEYLRVTGGNIE